MCIGGGGSGGSSADRDRQARGCRKICASRHPPRANCTIIALKLLNCSTNKRVRACNLKCNRYKCNLSFFRSTGRQQPLLAQRTKAQ